MIYKNNYNNMSKPDLIKLWERVGFPKGWLNQDQTISCLDWIGCFDKKTGHPIFRLDGQYVPARIVIFESCHGPVDPGKFVFSNCGNKHCVNPHHLIQEYYFRRQVIARGNAKDPSDKRKKLKEDIKETHILRAFNGIKTGRAKTVSDVGKFLNINDDLAKEFLLNDGWQFINKYYTKDQLDMLRAKIGII